MPFWVTGGTGSWASTTNWSASSGGPSGATIPSSATDAIFDGNSGSGVVTIGNARSCLNFTTTGFAGSFATGSGNSLTCSGNFDGSVITGTKDLLLTMAATSGTKTINTPATIGSLTINGAGGTFTLAANLAVSGTTTFTNGTFNDNNFNISSGTFALGSGTKTVTMGSGSWICGDGLTGTKWDFNTNKTGLTINGSGGGSVACGNGANMTFNSGGQTYPMDFKPFLGGNIVTFQTTGATFNSLSLVSGTGGTLRLTASTVLNVGLLKNGTISQAIDTTSAGTAASINVTSTVVAQCVVSGCSFKDITASGSTIYDPSGTNVSGNTNIVFAAPDPGFMITRDC